MSRVNIYVLSTQKFLAFLKRGYYMACFTCGKSLWRLIGCILVSKSRANAESARRCLNCAIEKSVLTSNVVEVK